MEPFAVFLVFVGLAIIFISFFVSEKFGNKNGSLEELYFNPDSLTEEGKNFIMQSLNQKLSENADEVVIKTDDQLSMISNEKIMMVSEYSDQVLEKINQNHQEVVFLYNMLNEKESELKNLLKEMNETNAKANFTISDLNSSTRNQNSIEISDNKKEPSKNELSKDSDKKIVNGRKKKNNKNHKTSKQFESGTNAMEQESDHNNADLEQDNNVNELNNNDRILKMHREGMSIIEIAKALDLGQGEVKLVIELYKGI